LDSRFHILRHFAYKRRIITLALTAVQKDIYELRLPKFQVISGSMPREERNLFEETRKREGDDERRGLESEIDAWWLEIKGRLDKLVR
jgi:1-phosphatidylinositol-3-phosphate 5-kinase